MLDLPRLPSGDCPDRDKFQSCPRTWIPRDASRYLSHAWYAVVEAQARRVASAFLAPAMTRGLPTDLDWSRYLELKRWWCMSVAALVRGARDFDVISNASYTRAMKRRSADGCRGEEPGSFDGALPQPTFLSRAMAMAELSLEDVANAAQLPREVVSRIVGRQRPSLLGP